LTLLAALAGLVALAAFVLFLGGMGKRKGRGVAHATRAESREDDLVP
jgi:hypothetical protein